MNLEISRKKTNEHWFTLVNYWLGFTRANWPWFGAVAEGRRSVCVCTIMVNHNAHHDSDNVLACRWQARGTVSIACHVCSKCICFMFVYDSLELLLSVRLRCFMLSSSFFLDLYVVHGKWLIQLAMCLPTWESDLWVTEQNGDIDYGETDEHGYWNRESLG